MSEFIFDRYVDPDFNLVMNSGLPTFFSAEDRAAFIKRNARRLFEAEMPIFQNVQNMELIIAFYTALRIDLPIKFKDLLGLDDDTAILFTNTMMEVMFYLRSKFAPCFLRGLDLDAEVPINREVICFAHNTVVAAYLALYETLSIARKIISEENEVEVNTLMPTLVRISSNVFQQMSESISPFFVSEALGNELLDAMKSEEDDDNEE